MAPLTADETLVLGFDVVLHLAEIPHVTHFHLSAFVDPPGEAAVEDGHVLVAERCGVSGERRGGAIQEAVVRLGYLFVAQVMAASRRADDETKDQGVKALCYVAPRHSDPPLNVYAPRGEENTPMVSYSTTCVSSVTPIFSVLVSRAHNGSRPSPPPPPPPLSRTDSPLSHFPKSPIRIHSGSSMTMFSTPSPPPHLQPLTTLLLELVLARDHVREAQRVLVRLELSNLVEIEPPRVRQTRSGEVFCERGSVRVGHVPRAVEGDDG